MNKLNNVNVALRKDYASIVRLDELCQLNDQELQDWCKQTVDGIRALMQTDKRACELVLNQLNDLVNLACELDYPVFIQALGKSINYSDLNNFFNQLNKELDKKINPRTINLNDLIDICRQDQQALLSALIDFKALGFGTNGSPLHRNLSLICARSTPAMLKMVLDKQQFDEREIHVAYKGAHLNNNLEVLEVLWNHQHKNGAYNWELEMYDDGVFFEAIESVSGRAFEKMCELAKKDFEKKKLKEQVIQRAYNQMLGVLSSAVMDKKGAELIKVVMLKMLEIGCVSQALNENHLIDRSWEPVIKESVFSSEALSEKILETYEANEKSVVGRIEKLTNKMRSSLLDFPEIIKQRMLGVKEERQEDSSKVSFGRALKEIGEKLMEQKSLESIAKGEKQENEGALGNKKRMML